MNREKLHDFWFALRSDRPTIECYRTIRDNRRVLDAIVRVDRQVADE